MLFDRADGLRQIGHPGDGQPRGSPGAGFHDRACHADTAPLGDDHAVRTAQVSRAHDSTQVVRVLDTVTQHKKRLLAFRVGGLEQIVQVRVFDLGRAGSHALVVRRAAHLLQFVGGHALDDRAALLGQGGVIARHRLGHRVSQVDRVHRAAAFQQLSHGIFAPYQGVGAFSTVGCQFAVAGEFFHSVLHLYRKKPTVIDYAL